MTIMKMNDKLTDYDPEVLKKLHDIELMIFSDFIDICDKNNIKYFAGYGTALGAIRHEGFIPWDDDIDIVLLREDYNKFLEIMNEGNEKYDFFAMETTDKYFKLFGKLSLKGTKSYEFWQENVDFEMGINIDLFILDFVPSNKIKKTFYLKRRFVHRKLSWLLEVFNSDMYISKNKERLGRFINKIFVIIGINQKFLLNQNKKLRNNNIRTDEVCELTDGDIFPTSLFDSFNKVKFGNIEVNVPTDYDTYLRIMYGDNYMELPPEDERFNHAGDVDFGDY